MNVTEIVRLYVDEEWSTYQIAKRFKTNPQRIRRILIKEGVTMRTKGQAQKAALKNGTAKHPTEGRKRTAEERMKISAGTVDYWEDMPDNERERRSKRSKEIWDSIDPIKKKNMLHKASDSIRKAATEGSKLEKEVQAFLVSEGYNVQFHKKDIIPTQKLEVDLYLPEIRTIIEVDGLSHFEPIWGEEQLAKQLKFDSQKEGLMLGRGFDVIRVVSLSGSMAQAKLAKLFDELRDELKRIEAARLGGAKHSPTIKVIKYD